MNLPSAILPLLAILALLAIIGYLAIRPRILCWGAAPPEAGRGMTGDELILNPILLTTRAINVEAAPEKVWPWRSVNWLNNKRPGP